MIYDDLGAGVGSRIGFSEGGEAAAPFHPEKKPVDAYCACILDQRDCQRLRVHAMNEYKLKEQICEIGRRLYAKGFAAANDGNITIRLNDSEVLCTPTMVSKGFMKPEDICKVDYEGKQLAGTRKRTSEVLLHLAVYKNRPDVKAVVHCHPPHATAFAVAHEPIPKCVLPEVEVFLGEVPIADLRDARRPEVRRHHRAATSRTATPSSSPTTAPSRSAPTWRRPTGTPRSSTPIARS